MENIQATRETSPFRVMVVYVLSVDDHVCRFVNNFKQDQKMISYQSNDVVSVY